jgi:hypothetical protein
MRGSSVHRDICEFQGGRQRRWRAPTQSGKFRVRGYGHTPQKTPQLRFYLAWLFLSARRERSSIAPALSLTNRRWVRFGHHCLEERAAAGAMKGYSFPFGKRPTHHADQNISFTLYMVSLGNEAKVHGSRATGIIKAYQSQEISRTQIVLRPEALSILAVDNTTFGLSASRTGAVTNFIVWIVFISPAHWLTLCFYNICPRT